MIIKNIILLIIKLHELTLLDFGCSEKKGGSLNNSNETILDTEYYEGKYYIFDIIFIKEKLLFNKDYKDRIVYIDKLIDDFAGCTKVN